MPLKDTLGLDKDPLYLVDGTSYLYRGFYAYPELKRSDGFPTNALFIALRILLRVLRDEKPKYLGFFMDGRGPTFRHEMYGPYKAQRPRMPEPLAQQIEPLQQAVRLMGLSLTVSEGVEADDCIASLAQAHKAERPVVIIASDKDLKQCLDTNVWLWDPAGKKDKLTSLEDFRAETGLEPGQWPDFQALTGDSSDNIPGVPGVGPKTAQAMLADHPTLEALRDDFDNLSEKFQKKLEGHMEDIFLYRELTRMRLSCQDTPLDELAVRAPEVGELVDFLETYEFRSMARELAALAKVQGHGRQDHDKNTGRAKAGNPGKAASPSQPGLSLLDLAEGTLPEPDSPLELERLASPDQLPALDNKEVGLVAREHGFRVGVEGKEYALAGKVPDLPEIVAKAGTVACPDLHGLMRADRAWEGADLSAWFDLGLAAYLLNPEDRNYSWDRLRQSLFQDLPGADVAGLHPEAHGLVALAYMRAVAPRLRDAELDDLMRQVELPLIPVLAAMERRGIAIDPEAFQSFLDEVSARLETLQAEIIELAGREFNVRSSQQLAEVLFDHLGLKPAGKTPGGALSTANQVLERLKGQHGIIDRILDFRMLEKLRSTYLEPMPKLVGEDGRIHTSFNQLATATGRLSSSGPNLQNIPIRGPQGGRMRACFTAGPGKLLAAADYSQIELRVLAHFSGDPALKQAFARGEDIHATTAALIFERDDPSAVTIEERRSAKTINFGLIYGMGPQRLARELGVTMNQAKEFIERYFDKLSTLKAFYDGLVERATEQGFVTTWAGRRRLLPELTSRNQQMISQARRQAINTVIQGSAADIIKMAMIRVHRDEALRDLDARLILQVHDELLLEAPDDTAHEAGGRLEEIMRTVAALDVPLAVDWGVGKDWNEAH